MSSRMPEFTTTALDAGIEPQDDCSKKVYDEVAAFAKQGYPILIFGPTGAGKEFLARHYYNIFAQTDFYEKYREEWPERFRELRDQYSEVYSGDHLDVFLSALKPGVFQSLNSATIYPDLAESMLFGHEADSFTLAKTSPGLLEIIKYGILFLDEIGELPKSVQAKLLRAVDPGSKDGRRLSGLMDYSTKELLFIGATNRTRKALRKDFYYKIGLEVEIKGIEERPQDLMKAVPFFIYKALGKRKDYALVNHIFQLRGCRNIDEMIETEPVQEFINKEGDAAAKMMIKRQWPGNLRAIRRAIEASILRIDKAEDEPSFSRDFHQYLRYYTSIYSEDSIKSVVASEGKPMEYIFPSERPDLEKQLIREISDQEIFSNMEDLEKRVLVNFICEHCKKNFSRKNLEDRYSSYPGIKHKSEAHIRGRIKKLLSTKMLLIKGKNKSTRYELSEVWLDTHLANKKEGLFSIPVLNKNLVQRDKDEQELHHMMSTTYRVYIAAAPNTGKTTFITQFYTHFAKEYNFFYYALGKLGIQQLFEDILKFSKKKGIEFEDKSIEQQLEIILPIAEKMFAQKDGQKSILILDNVHFISDVEDHDTIVKFSDQLTEVLIILIGENIENVFEPDFTEFPLVPWNQN